MQRTSSTTVSSGKLLTVLILIIAALAAGLAWWHNWNKGRQALAFWGGQVANRIRTANGVELWVFASGDERVERQEAWGDRKMSITEVIDLSTTPGLVHARQALISDASFDWTNSVDNDQSFASSPPAWQYAIHFTASGKSSLVLLDLVHGWAAGADRPSRLAKLKIAAGLKRFLEEQVRGGG